MLSLHSKQYLIHLNELCKLRLLSTGIICKQQQTLLETQQVAEHAQRTDAEWLEAKTYETIPGPSRWRTVRDFMPGGKLYKKNLIELNRIMRETYGDIYRMKGMLGKPDVVFTYNPKDFEVTYRNEGIWPIRIGLESFTYYRKVKRPDVFNGIGGLVSEQGKAWADIRNKVNPVLMKRQNVRENLPQIDQIVLEFIEKLDKLRDTSEHTLKSEFYEELKMWAFESISYVALNTRVGLLSDNPDSNAQRLAQNMSDFFTYSFKYDLQPSIWPYYETADFKKFLQTYDNITEITTNYINAAIKKFETEANVEAKSVLEKLCRLDRQIAVVMAMDMLMAGIDTTSSAFITILYHISKNPEKQAILRREIESVLPKANAPLTTENTKNLPYLRACIKEGLRITSVTPGNFRLTTKDLVLSGYQVPKGTGILMNVMALSNTEQYFPKSDEFIPERWLKTGDTACPAVKSTNPFVYLPFGFGPRTCIGKRIAELEIETLLMRLLRRYKISWLGASELSYISNIILVPHGDIRFKFEPVA